MSQLRAQNQGGLMPGQWGVQGSGRFVSRAQWVGPDRAMFTKRAPNGIMRLKVLRSII